MSAPASRGPTRSYASDAIEVHWEPRLCIHVQHCVHRLPAVFRADERPWIVVDGADADAVAETIEQCPTGALHRRLDGGAEEDAPSETVVDPRPDGPLFLRGRLRIVGDDGHVVREDTRVALCRCGGSANKPFCDGTHGRIGFRTS
jgi:uncharacterized Fe-S cluster protein YjdI